MRPRSRNDFEGAMRGDRGKARQTVDTWWVNENRDWRRNELLSSSCTTFARTNWCKCNPNYHQVTPANQMKKKKISNKRDRLFRGTKDQRLSCLPTLKLNIHCKYPRERFTVWRTIEKDKHQEYQGTVGSWGSWWKVSDFWTRKYFFEICAPGTSSRSVGNWPCLINSY